MTISAFPRLNERPRYVHRQWCPCGMDFFSFDYIHGASSSLVRLCRVCGIEWRFVYDAATDEVTMSELVKSPVVAHPARKPARKVKEPEPIEENEEEELEGEY